MVKNCKICSGHLLQNEFQKPFCCVTFHVAETKAPAVTTDPELLKTGRAKAIFFILKIGSAITNLTVAAPLDRNGADAARGGIKKKHAGNQSGAVSKKTI